jgi:hypothetical protein
MKPRAVTSFLSVVATAWCRVFLFSDWRMGSTREWQPSFQYNRFDLSFSLFQEIQPFHGADGWICLRTT